MMMMYGIVFVVYTIRIYYVSLRSRVHSRITYGHVPPCVQYDTGTVHGTVPVPYLLRAGAEQGRRAGGTQNADCTYVLLLKNVRASER